MKKAKIFLTIMAIILISGCLANRTDDKKSNENAAEDELAPVTDTPVPLSMPPTSPAVTTAPENTPTPDPNLVSSFATVIYDKNENRVNNIKIAAEELDGTIIEPGEIFSFNETVGRRTKEKGYKEATIFVDGEKSKGVGGGICQVSTTLYNAALEAGLKIVERHRHSREVSYVEKGKDAAVAYNSKDLRFKNTKDYPIEIKVTVTEDEIRVSIYKKSQK
ncbi:putative factor for cell wall maintenance or synthesis YoaR [Thermoclostridium stercorarium subsp. stercorarium DSM 8532]|uniref:Putative factor for cell wall maintenance or synthesis YoaR n=2 Tax=Thermoclostridium stercorarium TaxID=1510 RepID=L7VJD3_THES1|nr:VanW family protein [Thermoclostridium stercorarium]AGC68170.1 putative factor for cell wall maintenance or synthesis YoaR [Thermoclostridium stercorarium subsp. stercorarium DSM 8532]AGI39197.1 hypothetical protein Clst_1129 [Thermoclostridium stercorarium subsp. stercorarium DSM 8532]